MHIYRKVLQATCLQEEINHQLLISNELLIILILLYLIFIFTLLLIKSLLWFTYIL